MPITWRASGADSQRMGIVGKSGSGKTTLARMLASQATRCAWIDVKGLNEPQFVTRPCTAILEAGESSQARAAALDRQLAETAHVAYQLADRPDLTDEQQADAVAQAAYTLGNVLLVIDDASGVLTARPPYYVNRAASLGRARGVGVLALMARAHNVPAVLRTEAEHIVLFQQYGDDDIDRLVREVGPDAARARELPRWGYMWIDREGGTVQQFNPLRSFR
jgi:energy-coupling factor transporter ATP-binding protein EcfA2